MDDGGPTPERFLRYLKPVQGALEAFCRRGLYDPSLTEDVLQEAIMRAFADFALFADGSNFRAWIFRYAHFGILETNRTTARKRHVSLEDEVVAEDLVGAGHGATLTEGTLTEVLLDSPELVLEQCDEGLADAVSRLRPTDRSVLLLKAVGEFKYREIAEIVGIPLGTVMSSLSRARCEIRAGLAEHVRASSTRVDPSPTDSDRDLGGDR